MPAAPPQGVPEQDDVNVSRDDITAHFAEFGFASPADVDVYERLLKQGFEAISEAPSARLHQAAPSPLRPRTPPPLALWLWLGA